MPITTNKDNSISINGFSEGIGQSVLSDFSDMMGVDITDEQGIALLNFKFQKIREQSSSVTVTFTDATDDVTSNSSIYNRNQANGRAVIFSTTGTLPTGLTAGTIYYITRTVSATSFKVENTLKSAVNGTGYISFSGGSGVHTMTFIEPKAITGWTVNSQKRIFAIDSDQRVWFVGNGYSGGNESWYLISGNTGQGSGDGNGIIYYKGYVLVWSSGKIDALADIQSATDTVTWTLNFGTVTISNSFNQGEGSRGAVPFLSINDDAIYFANGSVGGNYLVGLLEEVVGQTFNPASGTTFSMVKDVVTIPYDSNRGIVNSIKELNEYLVIGTYSDKIFFWDKKSPSFTTYLQLPENGIYSLEVVGGVVYVFTLLGNTIYKCDLTSYAPLINIPTSLYGGKYLYKQGVNNFVLHYTYVYNRELLFSISFITTALYPNERIKNYLMSYNLDTKQLVKKHISSYGEETERNANTYGKIHSILGFTGTNGENLMISSSNYNISADTTAYAVEGLLYGATIDSSMTYSVYSSYEPYIITGLMSVGETYNKKTLRELQVSFSRALATGQGVKIYYRRDDNSAWTLMKTIDFATYGAIKDIKETASITDVIDLQIKIELAGTGLTTPYLKNIRLIP